MSIEYSKIMLYLSLENIRYQTNFCFTYCVTINGKERCLQKMLRYETKGICKYYTDLCSYICDQKCKKGRFVGFGRNRDFPLI